MDSPSKKGNVRGMCVVAANNMQHFIILSIVVLASAMPTRVSNKLEPGFTDASVLVGNGTHNLPFGQIGFATLGGGTTGGGDGASVWTVWDAFALRESLLGDNRRIIYVRGRIDLTALFIGSPGVRVDVGRQKTIIGGDANAMIFGGGLNITRSSNVIIQNIKFHNALSYAPGEQPNGNGGIISMVPFEFSEVDAIGIHDDTERVWVDHCEFADDPWNWISTNENQRRHDGLIDIVRRANFVSISNNIFRNHDHVMLIGHNDNNAANDIGRLKTTLYNNWFQGVNQRNPRVRFGEVHVLNNLYTDIMLYGIGVGVSASVYAERNSFINTRRSWGFAAGVPNPAGNLYPFNNWLVNSHFDSGIPAAISWHPSQYYFYNPMESNAVEAHVRRYAGTW